MLGRRPGLVLSRELGWLQRSTFNAREDVVVSMPLRAIYVAR